MPAVAAHPECGHAETLRRLPEQPPVVKAQARCQPLPSELAAGVRSRSRQSNFKRQPLGDEEAFRMATAPLVKSL